MSEQQPLTLNRDGYAEVTTPNYNRNGRRTCCCRSGLWIGLICTGVLLAILVMLILVGSDDDETGQATSNDTALLLNLSFPLYKALRPPLREPGKPIYTIKPDMVKNSMQEARNAFQNRKELEQKIFRQMNRTAGIKSPTKYHQQSTRSSPEFKNITDSAVVAELSLVWILKQGVTVDQLKSADASALLREWVHCDVEPVRPCPISAKYRTFDGTCNNLANPLWGSSFQPHRRILPPVYDNNMTTPRTLSVRAGDSLPTARQVSSHFTNATPWTITQEKKLSMLFLNWGQFLDHDLTNTAASKGVNDTAITCCGQLEQHPECFSIMVDADDTFYAEKGVTCLDLVRSAPAPQCQINGREQMNQGTSYIDASMVYGSTNAESSDLRQKVKGNLRGRLSSDGRWLLPVSTNAKDGCNRPEEISQSRYCFKAGDPRVNDQLGLTSLHTIMMREHNRIATTLSEINPLWDDDRLYEETRRIVIAEIQHVTYNEFVPMLLGDILTDHLKLRPSREGYVDSYNPSVHAGTANEFATAAYRLHSMLQGLVEFDGILGRNIDFIQLKDILFNPFALWDFGKIDAFFRGSAQQSPRQLGTSFSPQVTNHFFQGQSNHGVDMFAINIQRGRDHGLAPYIHWRELCKLTPVSNWTDLENIMRPVSLSTMKTIYKDLKDVDLYSGILSELPLPGGIIGPVGTCILTDQFVRSKTGDRFWYETSDPLLRFSLAQLQEIRKVTLARLLCDNGDALDMIQIRAMESVSRKNPRRRCAGIEIPVVDLTFWEDVVTPPIPLV